ncbi:MAG: flippase-like domain-containing protein [Bacteroidales bacterium]|nr:flippase-like domain-containing protein [Bacteroidales bacterium]MCF8338340.1 flippase-like domain-containing protein [Bacteroidales bacterium]
MSKPTKTIKWVRHIVLLIVGFALFAGFIYFINEESIQKLKEIQWVPAVGALLATLGITSSIAFRWGTIVNALEGRKLASWHQYYHYFIQSRALGFLLPKDVTDFGVRILWLKRSHKSSLSDAGVSVFIDRLYDLMAMLIMLASVIPYWLGWLNAGYTALLMVAIIVGFGYLLVYRQNDLLWLMQQMLNLALRLFAVVPFIRKRLPEGIDIPDFGKKTTVRIYSASILKMGLTMTRFVMFAFALNIMVNPEIIILGTPLGQLGYLFSFTPGGLGIFEAGWYGILQLAAVSTQTALLFVVGQRILTIAVILILAFVSQGVFGLRRNASATT